MREVGQRSWSSLGLCPEQWLSQSDHPPDGGSSGQWRRATASGELHRNNERAVCAHHLRITFPICYSVLDTQVSVHRDLLLVCSD